MLDTKMRNDVKYAACREDAHVKTPMETKLMKNSSIAKTAAALFAACIAQSAAAVEFINPARYNPTWESAKPGASYSTDLPTAALLGNGSLGAVNGGDSNHKKFVLTRGDLWSCGDFTCGNVDRNIRPISFVDVHIVPDKDSVKSTDTIDLPTATLRTEGGFGKGKVKVVSFVSANEDVFVIAGVSDADDEWIVNLVAHDERKSFPIEAGVSADGLWVRRSTLNLLPKGDRRGWTTNAVAAFTVLGAELGNSNCPNRWQASATVKLKAGKPFAFIVCGDPARRFTWDELGKIRAAHEAWWREWWDRSRIALGDEELERFYFGQVYLLGSAVRKGKFPPGLYGIWVTTDNAKWHNDFHMNYNYVGTYYGCFAANRCDAAYNMPDPLIDYLPQAIRNAKEVLPRLDRCKGHSYKNTRAYLDSRPDLANGIEDAAFYPVALGPWGTSAEGHDSHWSQVSDGAFQCAVMCTHWEYTLDRSYLKKVWPVLDKTANFFLKWCEREAAPGGGYRYNVWDSHWEGSGLAKNSAPALGCVKHLFATLVNVAPVLREIGIDVSKAKLAAWKDMHEHLSPLPVGVYPIDGKPVKMLSGVENADGSANPSGGNALNLESVIPGEQFAFDVTPEFRALAVGAVDGNIAVAKGQAWSGINQTPKLFATAIRAGYPARDVIDAFKKHQLNIMQKNFHIHDNVHGVEKIGAMEFVHSMLVQCDNGFVKVFPNWTGADAMFENLRAKGCFLLSAEMKDGKVVRVEVKSEKGGRLRLVDPFGCVTMPRGWKRGCTRNSGETTLERDFKAGETALLAAADTANIKIGCAYPGGNVKFSGFDVKAGVVKVAPDLRDTKGNWFHWDFTLTGAAGRTLRFQFPKNGYDYLSSLGPAISRDGGRTWRWLNSDGRRHKSNNAFTYTFGADENATRFAVSIPYSQMHWDAACERWKGKDGVQLGVLCKSQNGRRDTELLRVRCRKGAAKWLFAFTARHHACETTANPVMEGVVDEILSGSPEGEWIRDNADCVFVPFMDKDGVEAGDQGKNRIPHDHNRDYIAGIYTSVRAFKELLARESAGKEVVFVDLHSPHVRSNRHDPEQDCAFTFASADSVQNARIDAFRRNWAETSKDGALVYHGRHDIKIGKGYAAKLEKARKEGFSTSRQWVASLTNCWVSICCEFGYSLCGGVYTQDGGRELGRNMLKALSTTVSEDVLPPFKCSDAAKAKARHFVDGEKQFHLGFLPTEQSNPITATLEEDFKRSTLAGVQCLQRGDRQIPIVMRHVFAGEKFGRLVDSMVETVSAPKGRIIFSGCGATGRLSILLESMWRDFFHRRAAELSESEKKHADRIASIMTGGDFALIRSVEFFEDFAEGGSRQAAALGVGEGDTFVAITEGGETSSVLGTLKYAADHGAKCFLVFNNPADILRVRLDRCREAIDNPKVTVLDIYCGSMSLAGSTRMQATTSEQLLGSCALEAALCRLMPRFAKETAEDRTLAFENLLAGLESSAGRDALVKAIEFEKGVYAAGGRITYLADKCMLDLFTDNTERSPTFMLPPLRSSREKHLAQSWAFVKNPLHPTEECWNEMLRRRPRCLEFTSDDARSLGMPQSFIDRPPLIKYSDLVTYMIGNEPSPERIAGYPRAAAVVLRVPGETPEFVEAANRLAAAWPEKTEFGFPFPIADSPLEIWKHLAVKLAFNCLSTGTMAASGRVAGNWMSWVSISNKKLIDRGIRLLVELGGVDYEEAAQRIFAAEEWVASKDWTGKETPCAVQVALKQLRSEKRGRESRPIKQ